MNSIMPYEIILCAYCLFVDARDVYLPLIWFYAQIVVFGMTSINRNWLCWQQTTCYNDMNHFHWLNRHIIANFILVRFTHHTSIVWINPGMYPEVKTIR